MTLRLGLFAFRNDQVVLLAGKNNELVALGNFLQSELTEGKTSVAFHELAVVSKNNPVELIAMFSASSPLGKNSHLWRCSALDIKKLIAVGSDRSETYFDLLQTPPYFLVSGTSSYNDNWWATYG